MESSSIRAPEFKTLRKKRQWKQVNHTIRWTEGRQHCRIRQCWQIHRVNQIQWEICSPRKNSDSFLNCSLRDHYRIAHRRWQQRANWLTYASTFKEEIFTVCRRSTLNCQSTQPFVNQFCQFFNYLILTYSKFEIIDTTPVVNLRL